MSLWTYALISDDELKRELVHSTDDAGVKARREDAINVASKEIEDFLGGRHLVSRGDLVEYADFSNGAVTEFSLRVYPLISVDAVTEDGTALTLNTHYRVHNGDDETPGKLVRLSGDYKTTWDSYYRHVKIEYSGGYATSAGVPYPIKKICREYATELYREMARQEHGRVVVNDDAGTTTRFGPVELTKAQRRRLSHYADPRLYPTWESSVGA